MLIVLMQGALVTKTGSADGCGSTWPLCFGEVIPTSPQMETIIEYSHRIVSGLLGIFIILLAIWAWKKLPHIRETKFLAIMSIFFIIFQGFLGAGAVVFGQYKAILALHFGISAISLATVVLLTVLAFEDSGAKMSVPNISKRFRNYVFFSITYCYVVIYTGAYVKHTQATLACAGFPLCNGEILPGLIGPVGSHYFHRIAGIALFFVILIMFVWVIRKYRHERTILWGVSLSLLFVTAQLVSGVAVVFTAASLFTAMLHALIISLLFTTLCYLTMILTRKKF